MVNNPRTARARIAKLEGAKPPEPYEIQIIWLHDWKAGKAGGYTLGDKIVYEPGKPPKIVLSPEGYSLPYGRKLAKEQGQTPDKPEKTE